MHTTHKTDEIHSTATHSAWKMWFFEELLVKVSGPSHQIARRALPTLQLKGEWLQLVLLIFVIPLRVSDHEYH